MEYEYYYNGVSFRRLDKILSAIESRLDAGESNFKLKNGREIQIYGDVNDALLVDDNDCEHEFKDKKYGLAYFVLHLSSSAWLNK